MFERQEAPTFAAVLAAGKGTRMRSNRAKVLHTICGVPMVNYVIAALEPVGPEKTLVIVGHQADEVRSVLPSGVVSVLQEEQNGTGDAVRVALESVEEEKGVLLVVNVEHRFAVDDLEPYRHSRVPASQQEAVERGKIMRQARSRKKRSVLLADLEKRYCNVP